MAKWIYFHKSYSETYSLSTPVTGFPLYDQSTGDYILTETKPGDKFTYYCYDDGAFWRHRYAQLKVHDPRLNTDKNLINSIYTEGVSRYNGYTYEVLPNKLLHVDTATDLSSFGTEYTEHHVSGRFLVKTIAGGLPNACLVPVQFTVNGTIYDGFGNYDDSQFLYSSRSDYSSSETSRVMTFISDTTILPTKYLTKSTDNKVARTDIAVGDIIDFGDVPQNVPSVLTDWLDLCTEYINDAPASEPIRIPLTTTGGIQLNTANKHSPFDIVVYPELQEKSVTENGEVTPDTGYSGLSKVTINVPIPDGYIVPEGSLEVTTNGTHDVTNYAEISINVPSDQPQLYAPTATLVDGILTIEDNENNGAFTTGYDIYINGEVITSIVKEV
jgi:hypothetical protein